MSDPKTIMTCIVTRGDFEVVTKTKGLTPYPRRTAIKIARDKSMRSPDCRFIVRTWTKKYGYINPGVYVNGQEVEE